jgi:putative transposase
VHFRIRHGDKADTTVILTALGVDLTGNKEVLALRACAEEGEEWWLSLLQDVRMRGASQIDLIVTDGHDGLLAAVAELFAATRALAAWSINNAMCSLPFPDESVAMSKPNLLADGEQPTQKEALTQLAAFKAKYGKRYRGSGEKPGWGRREHVHILWLSSGDASAHSDHQCSWESPKSMCASATSQVDVFTTETICLTIVWATMQGIRLHPHLAGMKLKSWVWLIWNQPTMKSGSDGGVFLCLFLPVLLTAWAFFCSHSMASGKPAADFMVNLIVSCPFMHKR